MVYSEPISSPPVRVKLKYNRAHETIPEITGRISKQVTPNYSPKSVDLHFSLSGGIRVFVSMAKKPLSLLFSDGCQLGLGLQPKVWGVKAQTNPMCALLIWKPVSTVMELKKL